MNKKGFTVVEVIVTIVIISLVVIIINGITSSTLAISKEKAYDIMKNNIIKASENYIKECTSGIIECDFSYETNNMFSANKLKEYGYLKELTSPIDNTYIGDCLTIKAKYDNGVTIIDLNDNCY